MDYQELETKASEWVKSIQGESFELDEVFDAVSAGVKFENEEESNHFKVRLRNVLDTFDSLARPLSSDTFYLIEPFFKGMVFYCKPRPFELKEGILVTGCRFEPFHPEEVFADELQIQTKYGKIGVRDFVCDFASISDLYFLLGPALTIDLLSAESQDNFDAIRDADGLKDHIRLEMNVFDFAEFYRQTDFRSGDLIRFEIESYMDGKFKAARVSRTDAPLPEKTDKWIDDYEKGLSIVCRDFKDSLEIPAQLMMGYIAAVDAGKEIRTQNAPPIDLYHTMMHDISFNRNGMEWTLVEMEDDPEPVVDDEPAEEEHECSCGHDHEHEHECSCGHNHGKKDQPLSPEDFTISHGCMDSLEGILRQNHATVNEVELNALMFSTLANGSDDFEEFTRTNGDLIKITFVDEAQEAAFLNYVEDRWETSVEHYGYNIDSLKAPLRERLLELIRRRVDLLPMLKKNHDLELAMDRVRRSIDDTLAYIDRDAIIEEGTEFESLELRVGDIEDEFDLVADKLDGSTLS